MIKKFTESRVELAMKLRKEGYNCSQCVVMSFPEITGLTDEQAARVAASFGGGFGGSGNTCGVVSALGILRSFEKWAAPSDKANLYLDVRMLKQRFENKYGSSICSELKTTGVSCQQLIRDAIEMASEQCDN